MEFDNLDDLRVLVATAETGGLTSAGRRCGLSTAAVSAAIHRLEQSLAVRLFDRTTRAVRPTAEGEIMIDHARRALELVSEGRARARAGKVGLTGAIRVTVGTVLARELLAAWLADFAAQHVHIQVQLQVSDAYVDLVREGIDVAFRSGPLADSSHTARLLVQTRCVACASPEYLSRRDMPRRPEELAQHECLIYSVHGRPFDQWRFEPAEGGPETRVKVSGRLASEDAGIAQHWGLHGHGVLYHSELALSGSLAAGRLVRLLPGWVGEPRPLYAVLPSKRYVSARVQQLIDCFAARFAREPALLTVRRQDPQHLYEKAE